MSGDEGDGANDDGMVESGWDDAGMVDVISQDRGR